METVSFITFLEEKITEILLQLFFLALVVFLLFFFEVHGFYISILTFLFLILQGLLQWFLYHKKVKANRQIIELTDQMEAAYYIADILPRPKELQNEAYYYALQKACKAMNDTISRIETEQLEYQEYIESFVHEIKVPIAALSLTFDNTQNHILKKETDKIFQLVEQMLFYARSENTEKDYFVKELFLEDVIHRVLLKFRHALLEQKTIVEITDLNVVVYTDEKWLNFILSQIIQNSVKYFNKQKNMLKISCQNRRNSVLLTIEDNGCGIKKSDIPRVFDKGFTGSNRKNSGATGMGLYLAKKLCENLGLQLELSSEENAYTRLTVIFPKGTVHSFSE